MPLRTQTTMSGDQIHSSPEQVERFWHRWAQQRGFDRGGGLPVHTLRPSTETLTANVSSGRWVADCPACGGGIALWKENPRACCLTCGTVYNAIFWPDDNELEAAEALLMARESQNRGWRRDIGETLDDLRQENLTHGLPVSG